MATFTYTSPDKYSSSSLGPFGRISIPVSTINAQAKANIPSGAVITKVTMSCEFNQKIALGSSKGDVYFYWARSNSATDELERIYTGAEVVKEDSGWQPISYEITKYFHKSGTSVGQVSLANAAYLFYEGYTFVVRSWYLQNAKVIWEYTVPATCVVTLNPNGGTVSPTTVKVTAGSTYGTLPTPTRTGYKFNYWSREDGTRIYSSTVVNSSHTLVANWTVNTYTITATAGTGGTVSGGGTYNYGAEVTLIAEPSAGYKFKRWTDGDTNASRKITVTGAASYVAEFEKIAPEIEEVALIYSGSKVSATNKVVAGEGFVVKVRLK